MANKIQLKRSSVAGRVPATTDLDLGELALNTRDGKLYTKTSDGSAEAVVQLSVDSTVVKTTDSGTVTSAMLADGTIVNADINASAAIAGTKISPDFGSQNVITTGSSTAASFIPTSSTVPTNGVYLPSANNVAISTNGTGRLFVNASGVVGINGINTGSENTKLQVLTGGTASDGVGIYGAFTSQGAEQGAINFYGAASANGALASIVNIDNRATGGSNRSGSLIFKTASGSVNSERMRISNAGTTTLTSAASTAPFIANISATEVARIDSSGRLLIGTSSALANTATALIQSNSQVVAPQGLLTNNGGWSMMPTTKTTLTTAADFINGHTVAIDLSGILVNSSAVSLSVSFTMNRGNSSTTYNQTSQYLGQWTVSQSSAGLQYVSNVDIVASGVTITSCVIVSGIVTLTFNTSNVRDFKCRAISFCTSGTQYPAA
jgi:hypothetical protein